MARQIINPSNEKEWLELRTQDITSTEIGALFGISPYVTEYELWHRKKNQTIVDFEENERMKWGTLLQDSIAAGIAEEQGWQIRRMDEYIRGSELRLGSSFDFSIEPDEANKDKALLEIKNVDSLIFKQQWLKNEETGKLEAPLHIEIQVQHQLLVSGRQYAY
ncbi:MAG: YqaJ viral recombinase family protein, partial [Thermoplasmata archaeon]|nr:YqaJ viral recombinase family protein [Thermoplasmata archaeon]